LCSTCAITLAHHTCCFFALSPHLVPTPTRKSSYRGTCYFVWSGYSVWYFFYFPMNRRVSILVNMRYHSRPPPAFFCLSLDQHNNLQSEACAHLLDLFADDTSTGPKNAAGHLQGATGSHRSSLGSVSLEQRTLQDNCRARVGPIDTTLHQGLVGLVGFSGVRGLKEKQNQLQEVILHLEGAH